MSVKKPSQLINLLRQADQTFNASNRTVSDRITFFSALASFRGSQGWQELRWHDRLFVAMQTLNQFARVAFRNSKRLIPDQCDVLATAWLRIADRLQCFGENRFGFCGLMRWRANVLLEQGLKVLDRSDEADSAQTRALLWLSYAELARLQREREKSLRHCEAVKDNLPQILSSNQLSRVHRGLAYLYAFWNDGEGATYHLEQMDEKAQSANIDGVIWPDLRHKNEAMRQQVQELLRNA